MTHSAFGPTVSLEEAQRIEKETAEHLLKSRKLSLIVDLDQTIVHATVDPTVGEWIAEGEAWESQQSLRASSSKSDSENPEPVTPGSLDDCNPNWEALKDVKKFKLGPDSFTAPGFRDPKGKGKSKSIGSDGCMYYIKPRCVSPLLVIQLFITKHQAWLARIFAEHGNQVRVACLHHGHTCICRTSLRCY